MQGHRVLPYNQRQGKLRSSRMSVSRGSPSHVLPCWGDYSVSLLYITGILAVISRFQASLRLTLAEVTELEV